MTYGRKKLKAAWPEILFFVVLFAAVFAFFGLAYAMTVSVFTILFQIRKAQENSTAYLAVLFVLSELLAFLAVLATRSFVWCVVLNALVPLVLVVARSNQFMPKGYFASVMIFVFHQLIPAEHVGTQAIVVAFCWAILTAALKVYAFFANRDHESPDEIRSGLRSLEQVIRRIADGALTYELEKDCFQLETRFHHLAYRRQNVVKTGGTKQPAYDAIALLFQRSCYLAADKAWQKEDAQWLALPHLTALADYVGRVAEAFDTSPKMLIAEGKRLKKQCLPEGRVKIYYESTLQLLRIFLEAMMASPEEGIWKETAFQRLKIHLKRRFRHNFFERRFALRLSLVLVLTFGVTVLFTQNHMYWLPMHAFLLLQPQYEDSTHRMVTRPIGTAIGCVLVSFLDPYLQTTGAQFSFAVLMTVLLYCSTPGEWVQPIFTTGFALVMASMTARDPTLPFLRIFYLLVAVVIVSVVNGLCFPVTKRRQFQWNLQALFQLHGAYWALGQEILEGNQKVALQAGGLLNQFHLTYRQAMDYVESLPPEMTKPYQTFLVLLWHTFSEVELTVYFLANEPLTPKTIAALKSPLLRLERGTYFQQPDRKADITVFPTGPLRSMIERYLGHARQAGKLYHQLFAGEKEKMEIKGRRKHG